MQALDSPMSTVPKKLQVSGDPDLVLLSLVQHLFHFSQTKIQLRLVELNVEKVSTRLDLVSSVPITIDMHFVVITLPVASKPEPPYIPNLIRNDLVSINLSDFAKLNLDHLLAHGSGSSFAVTKELVIIMFVGRRYASSMSCQSLSATFLHNYTPTSEKGYAFLSGSPILTSTYCVFTHNGTMARCQLAAPLADGVVVSIFFVPSIRVINLLVALGAMIIVPIVVAKIANVIEDGSYKIQIMKCVHSSTAKGLIGIVS
ncbi:hypothetical protein Sjap_011343 [Stephania japonica]|uniref:Uncharacterized protein n=1 Tax=Stephania japonica TaxID=461633 RepID=A0AAP0P806_9MAGN